MMVVMVMMIMMMKETKSLCRNLEQSSTQQGKAVTAGSIGCYTFKNPLTRERLVSGQRIYT